MLRRVSFVRPPSLLLVQIIHDAIVAQLARLPVVHAVAFASWLAARISLPDPAAAAAATEASKSVHPRADFLKNEIHSLLSSLSLHIAPRRLMELGCIVRRLSSHVGGSAERGEPVEARRVPSARRRQSPMLTARSGGRGCYEMQHHPPHGPSSPPLLLSLLSH